MSTVLISGASVAGLTLAYWLRERGLEPTVVERAPAPRPGGQAIDVRGVALDVLERMGLLGEARAARTRSAECRCTTVTATSCGVRRR
ncbi:FAD-dependent monooxygenase [Streptomyces tubbatahanensis]|uniref:FAD-dependent monooxygenase n=1 Tax=Streptomyces tubbatahanensis TaxID=2923272 RepID=UPI00311AF283